MAFGDPAERRRTSRGRRRDRAGRADVASFARRATAGVSQCSGASGAVDAADVEPLLEIDRERVRAGQPSRHVGLFAAFRDDEVGDGVRPSAAPRAGLLVGDRHAERALDLEHELEHVDRVEAEAFAEQRACRPRSSSGAIGSRRLRTIACLISCFQVAAKAQSYASGHYSRPPSTPITWPVMYAAASDARNATSAATSRGVPGRPTGIAFR